MRLLNEFILWTLNEGPNDVKDLISINARLLKKQGFEGTPRELQNNAKKGPVFDKRTLNFIQMLGQNHIPHDNRKVFVKWVADQHMKGELDSFYEEDLSSLYDYEDVLHKFRNLVDWINRNPNEFLSMSYWEAIQAAFNWHREIEQAGGDDSVSIVSADENVVYTWPDGWRMVKVPSSDCSAEGQAMGHCVGGYGERIDAGQLTIFSLRDPNDKPHVTIQADPIVDNEQKTKYILVQIKGKQNLPPVPKYARYVYEWLKQMNIPNFMRNEDFVDMIVDEQGMPHKGLEDIYHKVWKS